MTSCSSLLLFVLINSVIVPSLQQSCDGLPPNKNCGGQPVLQYYYDTEQRQCVPFVYAGCDGVLYAPKFNSLEQCQEECEQSTPSPEATDPTTPPPSTEPPADICDYRYDTGSYLFGKGGKWFYYNNTVLRCQWFYYLGEGGNPNKFMTKEECISRCVKVKLSSSSVMVVPSPSMLGGSGDSVLSPLEISPYATTAVYRKSSFSVSVSKSKSSSTTNAERTSAVPSAKRSTSVPSTTTNTVVESSTESRKEKADSKKGPESILFIYGTIFVLLVMLLFCAIAASLIVILYLKHKRQVTGIHALHSNGKPTPSQFFPSSSTKFSPSNSSSSSSTTSSASLKSSSVSMV